VLQTFVRVTQNVWLALNLRQPKKHFYNLRKSFLKSFCTNTPLKKENENMLPLPAQQIITNLSMWLPINIEVVQWKTQKLLKEEPHILHVLDPNHSKYNLSYYKLARKANFKYFLILKSAYKSWDFFFQILKNI